MFWKLYWNQVLQNKLLASGKHLYDDKSSKKQFFYQAWSRNQKKSTCWVKVKNENIKTVINEIKPREMFQKTLIFLSPWCPHLCISEGKKYQKFRALSFLKTIVFIFLFSGDLKHAIKLSQILKIQPPN